MSSKRRLRKNGCTGKVIYKSAGDALAVVSRMKRKGRSSGGAGHLNAYRCPINTGNHPRHWHVGNTLRADRAYVP